MMLKQAYQNISSGFFAFWVNRRRVTLLLIFLIIAMGGYSLFAIPKESSPTIEFGIITINTPYIGASPEDIDSLITTEIEQAIKDIDGIDKIESQSQQSVSAITVTLTNDAESNAVLIDIKDEVEKLDLPSDAEDPVVTEITTDTEQMFDVLLYAPADTTNSQRLRAKALLMKNTLEGKNRIATIDIDGSSDYDVQVQVDKTTAENIGLSLASIASSIQSYVTRVPLGNFALDDTNYDYRLAKTITDETDLYSAAIPTPNGTIRLSDIATITREYDDERILRRGQYQDQGYHYVRLSFKKQTGANIFTSSSAAKQAVEQLINTQPFAGLQAAYVQDAAKIIQEDYASLGKNALITLILVFLAVFIFVGLKEASIATLSLPVAFCITFLVLNNMSLSLNFMTNFSLIVTFGIAIDTIIVVMEGAAEKIKLGYNPRAAVLLAVNDYKRPLIAGTTTTCIVFIPLFALPGVTGKFLAYIPITIFITLVAALFISLTINPAVYYLTSKPKDKFIADAEEETYLNHDEKTILIHERQGKKQADNSESGWRHELFHGMGVRYQHFLERFLRSRRTRLLTIIVPIILLIMSFPILGPRIGFQFFPAGDNPYLFVDVTAPVGADQAVFIPHQKQVDRALASISEIENYYFSIQDNILSISVELFEKRYRDKRGMRGSFDVETELNDKLAFLLPQGFEVASKVDTGGPPVGKAVGVKLIADSLSYFDTLKTVADDFEAFLTKQPGTKNVTNSSVDTPGQFVFRFDQNALEILGLTPSALLTELNAAINGRNAGVLEGTYDNYDIKVLYRDFIDELAPSDVENMVIATSAGAIRIGDVADYTFATNINAIQREDGNIVIKVESDMQPGLTPTETQATLMQFARNYRFPTGVTFQGGGENNENADIIQATMVAFVLALLMIYSVLVLQFNSLRQPAFIMYTVVMALLGTNIGLFVTGNPYSMAFGIGFIALTGIVVNDAIVFIDRINRNRKRGMEIYVAITEAGKSRLQPIILTTITTIVGLMSIVRENEFFAGLAFTIMFGLFVGSLMTLFVIPAIYYQFVREKKQPAEQVDDQATMIEQSTDQEPTPQNEG